jgi:HSP20 family protein
LKEAQMILSSFRPAAEIFSELNRMQSLLDSMLRPPERTSIRAASGASFPVVNVGTTPDAVEIMAFAPGVDPSQLQLTVDRGVLVIAGERKSLVPEEGDATGVYAQERFAGPFRRVVSLPEDADPQRVGAKYRDGVLRISVAKRESSKPRRIEVN